LLSLYKFFKLFIIFADEYDNTGCNEYNEEFMQQQQKDNSRIFLPTYELIFYLFAPVHFYFPKEMENDLQTKPLGEIERFENVLKFSDLVEADYKVRKDSFRRFGSRCE